MGTKNATYPDASDAVVKTQADIDKNKTNESFWTELMNADNRLYTTWNYEDPSYYGNRYVEFRIIQVGEHDNDGSNVTFMATHALPALKQANYTASPVGWTESTLYQTMNALDGYVMTGLSNLKDAVLSVTKKSVKTASGSSSLTTSEDRFWILSYSELTGTTKKSYGYYNEGTQYEYFKGKAELPENNPHDDLKIARSRSKSSEFHSWWLRTVLSNPIIEGMVYVSDEGAFSGARGISLYYEGVVPCFAM